MSLTEQLDRQRADAAERIPAEARRIMDDATAEIAASGAGSNAPREGSRAPDFALPDATGSTVRLAELLARGPVVLSFYRGGWCPYCNLELRALQAALPKIREQGSTLVAISPETPDSSLSTTEKNALEFPVLSDAGNRVAKEYGLVFTLPESLRPLYEQFGIDLPVRNGDASFRLPVPGTFVIDGDGTVRLAFVDPDYTQRLDPQDVVRALRELPSAV